MWRRLLPCVFLLLAGSNTTSAEMTLTFDLLSRSSTSDTYAVRLIGAEGLATYNIEVVFQAPGLTNESMIQAVAPASEYIFDDSSNFFAGVNIVGGGEARVTLTDFTSNPPAQSISKVNDLISLITIDTSSLAGSLGRGFVADTLVLSDLDDNPVAGFEELRQTLQAVPEPSSLLLVALAGGVFAARVASRSSRSRKTRWDQTS